MPSYLTVCPGIARLALIRGHSSERTLPCHMVKQFNIVLIPRLEFLALLILLDGGNYIYVYVYISINIYLFKQY